MKVSQFFLEGEQILSKRIVLEGHIVTYRENPAVMYLIDEFPKEGENIGEKIQLSSESLVQKPIEKNPLRTYWDELIQYKKTSISTELALQHYELYQNKPSLGSLEFFVENHSLVYLDNFVAREELLIYNKYRQLRTRLSYFRKFDKSDYIFYPDVVAMAGVLTKAPQSSTFAEFTDWDVAVITYKSQILCIGRENLSDIPMSIATVSRLEDIQSNQTLLDSQIRLESILSGHLEAGKQVLYLLPSYLHIRAEPLKVRGIKINSKEFYEKVLPPMRGRNTYANPIHIIGTISKSEDKAYSYEISEIREVAIMTRDGIFQFIV
jgi:hypothetical protein